MVWDINSNLEFLSTKKGQANTLAFYSNELWMIWKHETYELATINLKARPAPKTNKNPTKVPTTAKATLFESSNTTCSILTNPPTGVESGKVRVGLKAVLKLKALTGSKMVANPIVKVLVSLTGCSLLR